MTNQNAYQGTYYEDLFSREIAKDPQNMKKIAEAFSEYVPINEKIKRQFTNVTDCTRFATNS